MSKALVLWPLPSARQARSIALAIATDPENGAFYQTIPFFCGANDSVAYPIWESKVSLTSKTRAALASHIQAADQPARAEDLTLCFNSATWIWMAEIITGQLPKIKQENPNICIYIYIFISGFERCFCVQVACHVCWSQRSTEQCKAWRDKKDARKRSELHHPILSIHIPTDGTFRLDLWAPQAEPSEFRRFAVRHSSPMSSLLFHVSQRWHSGCRRGGGFSASWNR